LISGKELAIKLASAGLFLKPPWRGCLKTGNCKFSKSPAFGILSFHPVSVAVTGIIVAEGIKLSVKRSMM
jgi:hypothetical protein